MAGRVRSGVDPPKLNDEFDSSALYLILAVIVIIIIWLIYFVGRDTNLSTDWPTLFPNWVIRGIGNTLMIMSLTFVIMKPNGEIKIGDGIDSSILLLYGLFLTAIVVAEYSLTIDGRGRAASTCLIVAFGLLIGINSLLSWHERSDLQTIIYLAYIWLTYQIIEYALI
jgi:hypothetical protein